MTNSTLISNAVIQARAFLPIAVRCALNATKSLPVATAAVVIHDEGEEVIAVRYFFDACDPVDVEFPTSANGKVTFTLKAEYERKKSPISGVYITMGIIHGIISGNDASLY